MIVSSRGRYALKVVIDIAEHSNGQYIPMKDVANRQGISPKYLEQILPALSKNNILDATHGKNGGYRLAKLPDEIKAGDILRLAEGDLYPVSCSALGEDATCEKASNCPTKSLWKGLDKVINDYLDGITLTQLMLNKDI